MAKQTRQNQFCGPSDPSQASLGTWSQLNSQSCSEASLSRFLDKQVVSRYNYCFSTGYLCSHQQKKTDFSSVFF